MACKCQNLVLNSENYNVCIDCGLIHERDYNISELNNLEKNRLENYIVKKRKLNKSRVNYLLKEESYYTRKLKHIKKNEYKQMKFKLVNNEVNRLCSLLNVKNLEYNLMNEYKKRQDSLIKRRVSFQLCASMIIYFYFKENNILLNKKEFKKIIDVNPKLLKKEIMRYGKNLNIKYADNTTGILKRCSVISEELNIPNFIKEDYYSILIKNKILYCSTLEIMAVVTIILSILYHKESDSYNIYNLTKHTGVSRGNINLKLYKIMKFYKKDFKKVKDLEKRDLSFLLP